MKLECVTSSIVPPRYKVIHFPQEKKRKKILKINMYILHVQNVFAKIQWLVSPHDYNFFYKPKKRKPYGLKKSIERQGTPGSIEIQRHPTHTLKWCDGLYL
jgi:hypothetical protein